MDNSYDNHDEAAGHAGLDPLIVDSLLEKLATDDAFRAIFHANPAQALAGLGALLGASHGIPAPGDPYYCMTTSTLASKEEIAQARALLQQHLAAAGNHNVIFCFEADRIRSALECS